MTEINLFSSRIRCVCLVEKHKPTLFMDSIFLFKAKDFQDALNRALELGKGLEQEYLNIDNERVRWRLKEILSLDIIRDHSLDGTEIYSEFVDVPPNQDVPFDAEFHPELSQPVQTVFALRGTSSDTV